ncbi:MAG: hypothetical protein LUH47_04365 [Clostridiales bacterium]|nr:hypothetical protein [Clostridiales bacterium]
MPELTVIYENVLEKIDFPDSFGSAENDLLTSLSSYEDLYTSLYEIMLASVSASNEYDDSSSSALAEIMQKFGKAGTIMEEAENNSDAYTKTMLAVEESISNDSEIAEYINSENSTEEEKAAAEEYFSEINSFISSELGNITFSSETWLEDSGYMSKSELESAAEALRNKLNTTETPKTCMLSKYILLKTCDLLSEAGELCEESEFKADFKNELYIDYFCKYASAAIFLSSYYYENYNRGLTLEDFPLDETMGIL